MGLSLPPVVKHLLGLLYSPVNRSDSFSVGLASTGLIGFALLDTGEGAFLGEMTRGAYCAVFSVARFPARPFLPNFLCVFLADRFGPFFVLP